MKKLQGRLRLQKETLRAIRGGGANQAGNSFNSFTCGGTCTCNTIRWTNCASCNWISLVATGC